MTLSDLMKEMAEAGAPMAAIIIAVRAIEEKELEISERRAKEASRTRLYRERGGGNIPEDLRQSVFDRDGHACVDCGSGDYLQCDHIYPSSKGGETCLDNLQTLCRPCNARKKDRVRKRDVRGHSTDIPRPVVGNSGDTPSLDKESFPQTPFKEINPIPVRDARTRGARLPEGWKPKTCDRSTKAGQIIEHRGQQWAKDTLERFTNHWRAKGGRDACKVDWQATWANWVIEQDGRDARNGRSNGKSTSGYGVTVDAALAFVADGEFQ